MKEKLYLQSFIQYSQTPYINFMMGMAAHVKYYLLMMK